MQVFDIAPVGYYQAFHQHLVLSGHTRRTIVGIAAQCLYAPDTEHKCPGRVADVGAERDLAPTAERDAVLGRVTATDDLAGLKDSDLVIESVVEVLDPEGTGTCAVPQAAEGPCFTVTVNMLPDLVWSDGEPFTANGQRVVEPVPQGRRSRVSGGQPSSRGCWLPPDRVCVGHQELPS